MGWTIPLKNKNAQPINDSSGKILLNSKTKPNLIETDSGKEFYNNNFQKFVKKNINIKHYSRKTSLGAVFAEEFSRTIRNLLKRPVFEKGDSTWIDTLLSITKQYNNKVHSLIKLTPLQVSLEKNEGYVNSSLIDRRKK